MSAMSMAANDRRWVPVLFNPTAGPRSRQRVLDRLMAFLGRAGFDGELFPDRDELSQALRDPQRRQCCRCLVAAGGDGTVRWLVNEQRDFPLAVFPLGGENLLARHYGARRDPQQLVDAITAERHAHVDLGLVNGQYFTLMTSIGLDADVVERLHRSRCGHVNKWTYARRVAESLAQFKFPALTVEHPDGDHENVVGHHVFLFNFPEYAFRLPICHRACSDDGLLDLLVCRRPGIFRTSRYLWAILRRGHYDMPDVVHYRVKRVVVHSETTAPIQADGDEAGRTPAKIEVVPQALTLVVPQPS